MSERISTVRSALLGLTGLACVLYALGVLLTGRVNPVPWYVPGALGLFSALAITVTALLSGRRAAEAATDELYRLVRDRAARQAYWLSMVLFVALAVAARAGLVGWEQGFVVLGCLMGASFLLLFVWHDLRMR